VRKSSAGLGEAIDVGLSEALQGIVVRAGELATLKKAHAVVSL
jgi:hypothetical protein